MSTHADDPAHIAGCAECRAGAALAGSDVDLSRVWVAIAAVVWARPVGWFEREAGRLLRSPGLARALLTTPSLLPSWIVACVVVLSAGVLVTWGTGVPCVALLAPALAGTGIAYAYGPGVDPAFELSQTMPISDRMVLLVRALAVFSVNAALGGAASVVSAGATALTFGWLAPMTMVGALGLAMATLARSALIGVTAALAGWCLVVLAGAAGTHDLAAAVARGVLTPIYLTAALAGAGAALYATSGRRVEKSVWP